MSLEPIALLLVGLIAGILSGLFGIGGGLVIVPVLQLLMNFDLTQSVGTSLAALLLPVGFFAVLAYYRANKIRKKVAAFIACGLLIGAIGGARIALNLPKEAVQFLYGIFLLWMSWRFIEPRKLLAARRGLTQGSQPTPPPAAQETSEKQFSWVMLPIGIVIGLVAGLFSGLFGIGGGIVIVPALVGLLAFDQKVAVGTSLAVLLMPVSIGAVKEYYDAKQLDVTVAALVAIGLVFGAFGGAKLALGLPTAIIKRWYGVFLLLIGLRFILPALMAH